MKRNFFKKLSFVLASAMVLTTLAPASGALAAGGPKLNASSKYLHLGRVEEGQNEFNFNISGKKSGWKYEWTSANTKVAKVNKKNGVATATGVGATKVTVVISDKDGEEVEKLTAKVTVRDNIKTVKISNLPTEAIAVGKEYDFNRSYVTESGSSSKTSGVTRWVVSPSETATIDDKGVFVATAAGEYTITANSFQSTAKYKEWLADAEKYAGHVTATTSEKVKVSASMVSAKQVDLDSVNVTFDSAMADVDKNISVYQLIGETKVKQTVAKVSMGTDNTVATVDLYIPFVKGSTYLIEYPNMTGVSFVAATTDAEDVASMEITTTSAVVNESTTVDYKLFNKDGVNITTDLLKTRVTMEAPSAANTWFDAASKKVTIFEKGLTTTVTATYHTYKHDPTTGEELGNVKAVGVIMGVDATATNITGLNAWTIVTDNNPNFDDVKRYIAVGDQSAASPQLFVKLNNKTGDKTGSVSSNVDVADFEFVSSDENTLIISKVGGFLFPVKAGEVTVIVYYGKGDAKTPVATITLTVSGEATATQFNVDNASFNLSNHPTLDDNKNVKVTVKDQLGRSFAFDTVKVERVSAPVVDGVFVGDELTTTGDIPVAASNGEATINFNADSKKEGTYVYRLTVKNISRVVTVTVLKPSSTEVGSRRLELGTTNQDMKVNSWDDSFVKAVTIKVVAYAQNGVKLHEEVLGSDYYVKVSAPYDASGNFGNDDSSDGSYEVVKTVATASGQAIVKAPTGTYVVTAYKKADNSVIGTQSFVTSDSQSKAVLAKIENQKISGDVAQVDIKANSTSAALIKVVEDALDFKVDGNATTIVEVSATGTPSSIAIQSVKVRYEIKTGFYLDYTVNLNGLLLQK